MTKKNSITAEGSTPANKELFLKTYLNYVGLSSYLFGKGDKGIYNINEMPPDNEFYLPAKEIAESLEIDWEKMSHGESNRIMLALLEDTYVAMSQVENNKKIIVEVKLKITK
ncbi:hypothetical protein [Bacteroides sp. 224]|uniref:hypothetical protein n=1 Tax=Bacteroides sp. 224 TaxID=2302936 RepID=UPI0013D6EFD2|nr:hypothetical protein [Bacteroides sp. 224]NDV64012.1 hypothetical protein [Bacteroides sp. 224]